MLPGFGPAAEPLLFRQKWPKPMTPSLARSDRADTMSRRAAQLARLKQGLPANKSVRPRGQAAGVSERNVRGAGILKISIAFHSLREVAVEDDRFISKEGSHADKNAVVVIWNVYT